MRNILLSTLGGVALALSAGAARADVISIQFGLNGLPSAGPGVAITPLVLSASNLGQTSFDFGSGTGASHVTVVTDADEGVVQGSVAGRYAKPVSGPATTYDSPYFSTGLGTIDIAFQTTQRFMGMLWGSVDRTNGAGPNLITFKLNGTTVGTVSGDDLYAATNSSAANGSQGYGGSYYTLLNDTNGGFNDVVLSSGITSFESASFESSPGNVSVPEPATLAILGIGLATGTLLNRRRVR